jgi:hypothetical protein
MTIGIQSTKISRTSKTGRAAFLARGIDPKVSIEISIEVPHQNNFLIKMVSTFNRK